MLNDGTTDQKTVTVNASDLPTVASWVFFKFASSFTFAATNCKVGIKGSSVGNCTFYRSSTTADWAKLVRLTANPGSIGTTDTLFIVSDLTAAGAITLQTVTMDETNSANQYGEIDVCFSGTLAYGFAASTNYYLKVNGSIFLWTSSTFTMGTVANPIPSTGSAILEFNCTSNIQYGLEIQAQATFNTKGNRLTFVSTKLAADAAAAATSLTTADSTGWKNGDNIALATTTQTASECESKLLTADAVTTALTIAAITNAHSGTSPTQGELVNLTRNVKVRGISTTFNSYINIAQTATAVNCQDTEFYQLGSATASKRGIDLNTMAASFTYCSLHDFTVTSSIGFNVTGSSTGWTFSNNVTYNIANFHLSVTATTGTWTVDTNVFLRTTDTSLNLVALADVGGTFTNNTMVGANQHGVSIAEASGTLGTFSNLTCHGNSTTGLLIGSHNMQGTITNVTAWRNTTGVSVGSDTKVVLTTGTLFGNTSRGISVAFNGATFVSYVVDAGVTVLQPVGILLQASARFDSCTMGASQTHSTGDVLCPTTGNTNTYVIGVFNNCLFASATEVSGQTGLCPGSSIGSSKHDQTAGLHKAWFPYGTISIDTTIFDTTPSQRLTPNNASNKLPSAPFRVAVANGGTVTVSVKVRESVAGDGTAYNGNRIRLLVRKNVSAGISADTVLATATVASAGAFETLSGTTAAVTDDGVLEFFCDCDGTTGWTNIDTWSVAAGQQDSRGLKYWEDGLPVAMGTSAGGAIPGFNVPYLIR